MTPLKEKPSIRGKFITFEGIDGCGKSTQARRLAQRLRQQGHKVLETREPGGTPIGRQLRSVLLDPGNDAMSATCELLLYLADRVQHLDTVIRPALQREETVICDRFHDATVAYQQHGRGLDLASLGGFLEKEVLSTTPDTTWWLDLEVELAQRRIQQRIRGQGGNEPRESRLDDAGREFHERVRSGYAAIHGSEPGRMVRVPATGDEAEIDATIWNLLSQRYDLR
ncbi:MAG: dTMP kinase [SAR324 cluster bacterium]|nr:dTMP kinase [SAR324 cluster bacterium]